MSEVENQLFRKSPGREAARLENKDINVKLGRWYHINAYTSGSDMKMKV